MEPKNTSLEDDFPVERGDFVRFQLFVFGGVVLTTQNGLAVHILVGNFFQAKSEESDLPMLFGGGLSAVNLRAQNGDFPTFSERSGKWWVFFFSFRKPRGASRWWFQIFFFMITPKIGEDFQLDDHIFQMG